MDVLDKKNLKSTAILLGFSILAAFLVNHFSPHGIELVGQWDESAGVVTAKSKKELILEDLEIEDVSIAIKIHRLNQALFVDARSKDDYEEGHIQGALSLPIKLMDELIDGFKQQVSLNTVVITYCSGRTCTDSHKLAQRLLEEGYGNVAVYIDGYQQWKEAGGPVEE